MKCNKRGFTLIEQVGQALPDNAPAKGHLAGFTLIELLVVVLIIGILAAVAVPKYQFAVDKTRFTKLENIAASVVKAEEVYYLSNGTYTSDWRKLDIGFSGTLSGGANSSFYSVDGWRAKLSLAGGGAINGVILSDDLLPDIELFVSYRDSTWKGKRACYAVRTNTRAVKLCQNRTNRKTRNEASEETKDIYYF